MSEHEPSDNLPELRALLDEFVLYTDDTPYSQEPTELGSYLSGCGFANAIDELEEELRAFITQREIEARIDELQLTSNKLVELGIPSADYDGEGGLSRTGKYFNNRTEQLKSKQGGEDE